MVFALQVMPMIAEFIQKLKYIISKSDGKETFVIKVEYNKLNKIVLEIKNSIDTFDEFYKSTHSPLVEMLKISKDIVKKFEERKALFDIKVYYIDYDYLLKKYTKMYELWSEYRSRWSF